MLESVPLHCPSCGEAIEVVIDCSVSAQEYVEDCFVCCRPMVLQVTVGADGLPQVTARREED